MTNLSHWQDDIEDALGGDFDGSLSGLCIMSLSFDFTRNSIGPHLSSSKENHSTTANINQQASIGNLISASSSGSKSTNHSMNHDERNENNSNCFKRFKPTITSDLNNDEDNRLINQNKIARQLQKLKNCLTGASPLNSNQTNANPTETSTVDDESANDSNQNRLSPEPSETSCREEVITPSSQNESTRSSTVDAGSPTPTQTCSSPSTHSHASSRSQSPSDMSLNGCNLNGNNSNNNNSTTVNQGTNITNSTNEIRNSLSTLLSSQTASRAGTMQNDNRPENQQLSIYSVKDSILNGSTLKESSFTTSVITTTAPMHFKNIPHPFSLKQFPLSPYHQFSNSSLNHDFYDRYLSHDGHQPLQTPLIGIERTQDLLSLKLPPHGLDDTDSQRFSKDWSAEEAKIDNNNQQQQNHSRPNGTENEKNRTANLNTGSTSTTDQEGIKRKGSQTSLELQKGFPFNYKSNLRGKSNSVEQHEPIDLNVAYEQEECCDNQEKNDTYSERIKHFDGNRLQTSCFSNRSKDNNSNHADNQANEIEGCANLAQQYQGQESMFGSDSSKQKFQYVLAAPISVATKLNEDTITYLNQGQAYEIKLENMTDVSEAKKGFMCSIINIGFYERHMQQAENELWQQWSLQHPNERIFSVDMKLSYNVFGVESDGLNKYEFLWDSSKAAGVFIRISSISTEFTPKKHGGEKGIPFKLSIETFSYNSKTHDSYFISAACCQIKVFKPKGAERKIRSDRDKISKRPLSEQDKYHKSCDHTSFKDCSLTSLHPTADSSLCYYRHSHGHFASKQVVSMASVVSTPTSQTHHNNVQQPDDEVERADNTPQQNHTPENHSTDVRSNQMNNDSESSSNGQSNNNTNNYLDRLPIPEKNHSADCTGNRSTQHNHYNRNPIESTNNSDNIYRHSSIAEQSLNHSNHDLLNLQPSHHFNQLYQNNHHQRATSSLASINDPQNFGMSYYGHSLPNTSVPQNISTSSYEMINGPMANTAHHTTSQGFSAHNPQMNGNKAASNIYRHLNQEKQETTSQPSFANQLRAPSFTLAAHNNFQACSVNHNDHCEGPNSEMKETGNNGGYSHDNYESSAHHPFHSNYPNHQSQLLRHRSASMTIPNANCSTYQAGESQGRHSDDYMNSTGNAMSDNHQTPNHHWHQSSGNTQITNSTSACTIRGHLQHNTDNNHSFTGTGNFDCHHCDSRQASPKKLNHHTSDSSSSCNSHFKNSSSLQCNNEQESFSLDLISANNLQITATSNCSDVIAWFAANRFGMFTKTFSNFSGSDLLRLSKTDLIEICGLIDGIRLYNSLHDQPIKPKRVLYICFENSEIFHPIYLYKITLKELLKELLVLICLQKQSSVERKQKINSERVPPNLTSSNDSRSSMGGFSSENGADDNFNQGEHYFNSIDHQKMKTRTNSHRSLNDFNNTTEYGQIDRLLIDGLTSMKIVATEQVVQILENNSVWKLTTSSNSSGLLEACISACSSPRNSK